MKKRVLALVLALVMAVGALPTGAWAADTGDTLVVSDSEAKVVTDQQKEQASTKVAKETKNTGGKPTQTQSQTVGESGDGPSTFATNTFYWNVSEDSIWGHFEYNEKEPKPATLYTGKQEYWFNIWWTGDVAIEEVELFVKWPGEKKFHSYAYWGIEDSKKYTETYEKFYTVGTFAYYWEVTYKNGDIQRLNTTNVSIYKGYNYILSESSEAGTCDTVDESYLCWLKRYSTKARNIDLNVYAAEGDIIKYKSNNRKVKVSGKGKVTIPKKFVGEVIISVSLPATKNFRAATDKVIIEIELQPPTITKLSSPKKGQIKVSWKKDSACDGYEIAYSTNKNFSKTKYITIKKNSATSLLIKGAKRKKRYYVRMSAYKKYKSFGKMISSFSEQSKTKSIKVK